MHTHSIPTGSRLKIAALATCLFVVAEFGIGWWANSLALISDAGHNLTDAVALLLTLWAFRVSGRPADHARTFGYHRVGVLAALANAVTLIVLAGYIGYEGYQRLQQPEPVASVPMIVVAIVAFAMNGLIVLALHSAGRHDLNVRSAIVHLAGDALSSVGVLAAGIAVLLTRSSIWDPVVSLLIAVFVLWSSWGIVRESINILLEGSPAGLHLDTVVRDMEAVPGVRGVHDLHIWSLGSNLHALSAHVEVGDSPTATHAEIRGVVRRLKEMLAARHAIAHATLETHCAETNGDDPLFCTVEAPTVEHDHAHEH